MTLTAPAGLANDIRWRLAAPTILFLFLSSIDRVNISFASLTMNAELGLGQKEYGLAAGILFIGYLGGQFPSMLWLQRVGFRAWILTLTLIWGSAATALAFINSPLELYILRIIIGFAEGGLAPGIVLYLGQFATERERAATFALPMLAIPASLILGGPISGLLLDMPTPLGMSSWRWMFLAEGLPTIFAGIVAYFYFPDTPKQAKWIGDDGQSFLAANSATRVNRDDKNDWSVLASPVVWLSALLWFCLLSGAHGVMFWLPQAIKQMTGLTALEIGFVNAMPWLGVGLGMYFNSIHSDQTEERFWHVGLPALVSAVSLVGAFLVGANAMGLGLLFIAGLGLGASQGAFWALPTLLFSPRAMAVGVVAISVAGNLSGIVISRLIGVIREQTGSFAAPLYMLAALVALSALIVVLMRVTVFRDVPGKSAG